MEEEADEEVNKVVEEITASLMKGAVNAPKSQEQATEDAELEKRMAALKN